MALHPSPTLIEDAPVDRRKARGLRSSKRIKAALLTLVGSGNYVPRAQDIAEVSGLSLRTVFRHIEDMESLFRELAEEMDRDLLPPLLQPYQASDWRGRLDEAIARRVHVFEAIMPIRTAANLRRFHSDFLRKDYQRVIGLERTLLVAVLPPQILADQPLLEALDLALCFNAWRRLRNDQSLSARAAEQVVRRSVDALTEGIA